MKYVPKAIVEEVNVTPTNHLVELGRLLGMVVGISIVIYIALGFTADWLVTRLSPELEQQIGQALIPTTALTSVNSDPRLAYVEDLLNQLKAQDPSLVDYPSLPTQLFETPIPNAGIVPGGTVLVSQGLLNTVATENELAFVLAHELGHFQARDALKRLGRSLVFVTLASVLGLGNSGGPELVGLAGNLTELRYSRGQERDADIYAINLMVERYGHGGYSLDFFRNIQELEADLPLGQGPEVFSTHPLTPKRIADLEAYSQAQGWSLEGPSTPLPETFTGDLSGVDLEMQQAIAGHEGYQMISTSCHCANTLRGGMS
ncbi:MAG: M48 family metallopeptidase [Cyanobacteria bacterium P01_A01_bin.123]